MRSFDEEGHREYEMRIQELLLELQDHRQRAELEAESVRNLSLLFILILVQSVEELKQELEEKKQTIVYLEEKVSSAESQNHHASEDVVSRSQVEEMESIFVDTINQLSARVMQLEEDKVKFLHSHSSSSSNDFRTENSHQLPAVPPRGARIEPGKVRARGVEPSVNGWINGKSSSVNRNKGRF
jgi:predicted RNase H-like nuclease (RuvC/YqgF family)